MFLRVLKACLLLCLLQCPAARGQWYYTAGIGIDNQLFLRDRQISPYKVSLPIQARPFFQTGLRFQRPGGFDLFATMSLCIPAIELPTPDGTKSRIMADLVNIRLMAGSGPHITLGPHSALLPFVQLGAGFFDHWGFRTLNSKHMLVTGTYDINSSNWHVLFGLGADWQFRAYVPSSLNLQINLAPLPLFREPIPYTIAGPGGVYNLQLQGRLLQASISYNISLRLDPKRKVMDY